jgi:site-specific recombinase XerD
MPENIRAQGITFKVIAEAGLKWSKVHKRDWKNDDLRIPKLIEEFGSREADSIKPAEMDAYISANAKTPATQNRLRALFSMIYREALRNGHVTGNPARLVQTRHVDNARIRFFTDEEEKKLTQITTKMFPHHADTFRVALHTGMRLTEQHTLEWD